MLSRLSEVCDWNDDAGQASERETPRVTDRTSGVEGVNSDSRY